MLSIINTAWVKYVNNQRLNNSKTGALRLTSPLNIAINLTIQWAKDRLNNLSLLSFYTIISTSLKPKFNQLSNSFTHNPQDLLMSLIKEI